MHRTQAERLALARRLLGTPGQPGPIDVGWLKARYGVEGSHIKRWREHGIPAARVDELEAAIQALTGATEEPPPEWARAMEQRLTEVLLANRETFVQTLAEQAARYGVERALAEQPLSARAPDRQGPPRERAGRR